MLTKHDNDVLTDADARNKKKNHVNSEIGVRAAMLHAHSVAATAKVS